MYSHDTDDMSKIAVANLLKELLEERKDTLKSVKDISKKLERYTINFRNGNLRNTHKIVYKLNEALSILGGDRYSQAQLEYAVLQLAEHINRDHPLPELTSKLLTECQKALTIAITGHFSKLEVLRTLIMVSVIGNTTLIKKSTLVPDAFMDALEDVKESRGYLEDDFSS
jgi:hypothetical protein